MNSIYDCYTLNNGMQIPCMGFGTYKAAEGNDSTVIKTAIEAGYRYFDTASLYYTEEALGQAIKESGIPREEFFIVSKLWPDQMGYENAKVALQESLDKLQMDYLDIYLIHWPRGSEDYSVWKELNTQTWKSMEDMQREGKIKALGLSNYLPHHMKHIFEISEIKPVVNQLELHPGYMQYATVKYCEDHNIRVQAWSPLGRFRMADHPLLIDLAEKYNVTFAQLCLRFLIQLNIIPLPKASSMERMKQNMDVFGFEIDEEDMYRILTMPECGWSGEYPDPEFAPKKSCMKVR